MMRSYPRSANARIAGSIEVGSPGSTSRRTIGKSFAARLTPCHAAALNERSSFPPMSKTIPTWTLDLSSTDAEVAGRQAPSPHIATIKINSDFIARRLYSNYQRETFAFVHAGGVRRIRDTPVRVQLASDP